jgi:hypothetical protein
MCAYGLFLCLKCFTVFYYACDNDEGASSAISPIARRAYEMAVESIREVFDIQTPKPGDSAEKEERRRTKRRWFRRRNASRVNLKLLVLAASTRRRLLLLAESDQ